MARRRKGRPVDGVILLDKPTGLSSNDALQKVKRIFFAQKAGHTGALDPLATGMLPICFGEATKFSQFLLDSDKRYRVIAKLSGDELRRGQGRRHGLAQVLRRGLGVEVGHAHDLGAAARPTRHQLVGVVAGRAHEPRRRSRTGAESAPLPR